MLKLFLFLVFICIRLYMHRYPFRWNYFHLWNSWMLCGWLGWKNAILPGTLSKNVEKRKLEWDWSHKNEISPVAGTLYFFIFFIYGGGKPSVTDLKRNVWRKGTPVKWFLMPKLLAIPFVRLTKRQHFCHCFHWIKCQSPLLCLCCEISPRLGSLSTLTSHLPQSHCF